MAATTNWDEVRLAYVSGSLSVPEVARRFGVSQSQAEKRCAREGWVEERERFRKESARKAQEKTLEEASEIGVLIFRIGKLVLQRFLVALRDGGLELTASDAERWAKILLALEEAGRAKPEVIVRVDFSQLPEAELDRIIVRGRREQAGQ